MIALTCTGCGSAFARSSRYASRAVSPFCSHACYSAHKRVGYINSGGYRAVTVGGKELLEHRAVAEQALGRPLLPTEDVHHADGQKLNNAPSNLEVLSHAAHSFEHSPLGWDIETAKALKSEGLTYQQIGDCFGVTGAAIHSAFRTRGLTRRYRTSA